MPLYYDTHKGADMPAPLRETVTGRVKSGAKDDFGVIDRGVIMDKQGNEMHCLLDAPNEQAIIDHHKALNVPLSAETIHVADAIIR